MIEIIKIQKLTVPLKSLLLCVLAGLLITAGFTVDAAPQVQPHTRSVLMDVTLQSSVILLCFGILVAVAMYSTFVAIGSRDKSHGFYALTAIVLIWAFAQLFNFYAYPESLLWIPVMLLPVVNGLFTIHFLSLKKYLPMMHKLVLGNGATALLFSVLAAMMPNVGFAGAILVNFVWLVLALIGGVMTSLRGIRSAIYFCGALGCLFSSVLLVLFVQINELTAFGPGEPLILLLGGVFYVILVSFAMVDKFTNIAKRNILSSESLEQMVAQRTDELQKANLGLEKLAVDSQAASEAKNTFLVNMSHEIRTPLTAIIGYADGMLRGDIRHEAKDNAISIISQNGSHLLHIINELLDISKIESGLQQPHITAFDLIALLKSISDMFNLKTLQKGLTWKVALNFVHPTLWVNGDEGKLRKIMINLIGNAVKFTDKGFVQLTVTERNDNAFYFEIIDSGMGITKQEQQQLFMPFTQGHGGQTKGGAGLGLAITKKYLELLGSTLSLKSRENKGTTVSFYLEMSHCNAPKTEAALPQAYKCLAEGQHISVLVVDDINVNRSIMTRILEDAQFLVTGASNGVMALDMMENARFDLVVTEINMPEIDGITLLNRSKKTKLNQQTPVMAISISSQEQDKHHYLDLGFANYIAKPFLIDDLFGCIKQTLKVEFECMEKPKLPKTIDKHKVLMPPSDIIEELRQTAELYRVSDVETQLKKLGEQGQQFDDFIEVVKTFIAQYDMEALMAFLDQHS
ncbi:MAG: ATP-binding protein [Psychrosphaera sp.]|nr:ATP-binding protein [Psychrosphaera sp.]